MSPRRAGFSLVSAIFLLAVISAAGAAAVRIAGVQRSTTTFTLLGARAHHAAASGLEWARAYALANEDCPPSPTIFALTEGGLSGFTVRIDCVTDDHEEGQRDLRRYRLTATAEWQTFGSRDYVSRRLEATISHAI